MIAFIETTVSFRCFTSVLLTFTHPPTFVIDVLAGCRSELEYCLCVWARGTEKNVSSAGMIKWKLGLQIASF